MPGNLDLIPSPGKLPSLGVSSHSSTLTGQAHRSRRRGKWNSCSLGLHDRGQPPVSGLPERVPSLSTKPHGSHFLDVDPVWRRCKELTRSQVLSPPDCMSGLDIFGMYPSCILTRCPPLLSGTKVLGPGGSEPLDGYSMPPFVGAEGISLLLLCLFGRSPGSGLPARCQPSRATSRPCAGDSKRELTEFFQHS